MTLSTRSSPTWLSRVKSYTPARRLAYAAAIAAAAAPVAGALHILGPYLLFCALTALVAVAVDVRSLPRLTDVDATRTVPRLEVTAPGEIHVAVQVRKSRRDVAVGRSVWLRDTVPPQIAADVPTSVGYIVEQQATFVYGVTPVHRGNARFGDLFLRMAGKLGVVVRQYRIPAAQDAAVWPDQRMTAAKRTALEQVLRLEGRSVRRISGDMSEFGHIRDFAVGDDPRAINWFATARRAVPMRNVYQPERGQHIILALDCGRTMGLMQADGKTRLDLALEAALLTASAALENGDEVTVAAFADTVLAHAPRLRGTRDLRRAVEAVYGLQPQPVYSSVHPLAALIHTHYKRRSLLILFSDLTDLAATDLFERDIRLLDRTHACVVASFTDEALTDRVSTPAKTVDEALTAGVAADLLGERRRFRERLRAQGVDMIEARTELFSAALNRYVRYKNAVNRF